MEQLDSIDSAEKTISASAFADTKPHYELLDGLRGVAALLVLWYHIYEGFAFASGEAIIKGINHGYLAVDFFFILSGFVISYAYDDRWKKNWKGPASEGKRSFTLKEFFLRRLIRLHPMVILSAVLGAVAFFVQGSVKWDGTHVAISSVMLALLFAMFMIPALPGQARDVRGNGEMFPLNGPTWSLFFEYLGNIIYALIIRRLSTTALRWTVTVLGIALACFTIFDLSGYGSLGVGWTLDSMNFAGGSLRMLFPFCLGMLISRKFKRTSIKGAFWICSAILAVLLFVPYIDGKISLPAIFRRNGLSDISISLNGVFEAFCIIVMFPLLVRLGASGNTTHNWSTGLCKFLGDISFPLYIIHYPSMYLFYAWLMDNRLYTLKETWHVAVPLIILNIVISWLCLKFYDEPTRRYLNRLIKK